MVTVSLESGSSVFLAGSRVSGVVSLSSRSCVVGLERVAVQIVGVVAHDPAWAKLDNNTAAAAGTTELLIPLGTHERIVFATPLMVGLSGGVQIPIRGSRAVSFSARLPPSLPPSFRGNAIKYSYSIVVSISQVPAAHVPKPQTTAIPIRIISPSSSLAPISPPPPPAAVFDYEVSVHDGEVDAVPDLPRTLDLRAFDAVAAAFERLAHPVCVNVSDGAEHLVRIAMPRTVFSPGEMVTGLCDYSGSDVLCHSVSVVLEAEEMLSLSACLSQRARRPSPRVVAEAHEVTSCMEIAPFNLPLPQEACHEFESAEVALRWLLAFTFVIVPEDEVAAAGTTLPVVRRPRSVSFTLPIHVLATSYPNEPCIHF
jgi:hypothetical protein